MSEDAVRASQTEVGDTGAPSVTADGPGEPADIPLVTECCHVPLAADQRFCPKCGWEARILNGPPIRRWGQAPSRPALELPDVERVASDVHGAWMEQKRAKGITSAPSQSTGEEQMRPYAELSNEVQEYDRATVRAVYAAVDRLRAERSPSEQDQQIIAMLRAENQRHRPTGGHKGERTMNGVIKRLVIVKTDDGQELFFHRSTVRGGAFESLREPKASVDVVAAHDVSEDTVEVGRRRPVPPRPPQPRRWKCKKRKTISRVYSR